jgi:predicted RNA binding protein YcfA (HicA-like mRNA interferase family)
VKAVTGREMCRALGRKGWRLHHVKGSHHILVRDDPPGRITVPVHAGQTLAPGTQHRIMKDAGLTEADL